MRRSFVGRGLRPAGRMIPGMVFLFLLAFAWMAIGQPTPLEQSLPAETDPIKLNASLLSSMKTYQTSLEKLIKVYDQEFKKKIEEVRQRRELYKKGYISRSELEQSQHELARAEARLKETERKIIEARITTAEATALERLLKLPPLAAGGYAESETLIRYNGKALWSIADAAKIQDFFSQSFGRVLPVSALGQSPFHDRMKFDHRDAMDVALHPDTTEGRGLMAYLRKAGIPFIAFRNGVPGSASGAHIHVGRPSLRAAAR